MITERLVKLPACISAWTVSNVREQIEKDLAAAGLLEKVEAYTNKVGFSERTNVPIEPSFPCSGS